MVYVAPPDEEILYTAQVEVHVRRGGPVVPFPSPTDTEVLERVEELKKEREDKINEAKSNGESVSGVSVSDEKKDTTLSAGKEEVNKTASTPGAASVVFETVNQVRGDGTLTAEETQKIKDAVAKVH